MQPNLFTPSLSDSTLGCNSAHIIYTAMEQILNLGHISNKIKKKKERKSKAPISYLHTDSH